MIQWADTQKKSKLRREVTISFGNGINYKCCLYSWNQAQHATYVGYSAH